MKLKIFVYILFIPVMAFGREYNDSGFYTENPPGSGNTCGTTHEEREEIRRGNYLQKRDEESLRNSGNTTLNQFLGYVSLVAGFWVAKCAWNYFTSEPTIPSPDFAPAVNDAVTKVALGLITDRRYGVGPHLRKLTIPFHNASSEVEFPESLDWYRPISSDPLALPALQDAHARD